VDMGREPAVASMGEKEGEGDASVETPVGSLPAPSDDDDEETRRVGGGSRGRERRDASTDDEDEDDMRRRATLVMSDTLPLFTAPTLEPCVGQQRRVLGRSRF